MRLVTGETGIDMNPFDNCSELKAELLGIGISYEAQSGQTAKQTWMGAAEMPENCRYEHHKWSFRARQGNGTIHVY